MLKLITGTPGSGKTLNTIKMVRNETHKKAKVFKIAGGSAESEQVRAVYYHGIPELNPDFGWHNLTDEQALKWYELPHGSIIIFDEAYNLFPTGNGKQPPEHVKRLATHRHQGFDIYMICQKVTGQIDPFVKGLINEHHHFERIFNSSMVNHFVWGRCESAIDARSARSDSDHRIIKLDADFFGSYKSAVVHTHKPRVPVNILVVVFIAVAVVAYAFRDGILGGVTPSKKTTPVPVQTVPAVPSLPVSAPPVTESLDYLEARKPRIANMPWTAPVYDDLRKPQSYPRPAACIVNKKTNVCKCFTQQATRLIVPDDFCRQVVQGAYFDDTIPDRPLPPQSKEFPINPA